MTPLPARLLGVLAAAALFSACDFPPVPHGAHAGIERENLLPAASPQTPPLYGIGSEPANLAAPEQIGQPQELRGRLVGNAVSSYVITPEGSHTFEVLEVTPQTRLLIGDQPAGLREIQPGSEVRATFLPGEAGGPNLALEIVVDPAAVGWHRGRSTPSE